MRRLLLLACLLVACGAGPREVVLVEMQNAQVEDVPVGLRTIETKEIWRQGQRVSVDYAVLLRYDPTSATIRPEKVAAGEELLVGGARWTVVRVEPGTPSTPARVLLRRTED